MSSSFSASSPCTSCSWFCSGAQRKRHIWSLWLCCSLPRSTQRKEVWLVEDPYNEYLPPPPPAFSPLPLPPSLPPLPRPPYLRRNSAICKHLFIVATHIAPVLSPIAWRGCGYSLSRLSPFLEGEVQTKGKDHEERGGEEEGEGER